MKLADPLSNSPAALPRHGHAPFRLAGLAVPLLAALVGCAGIDTRTPERARAATPPQWYVPLPLQTGTQTPAQAPAQAQPQPTEPQTSSPPALPHGGSVDALNAWWSRFDDPLLAQLVGAAQDASPTLASAASRLEQARAARTAAGAALLPTLDAAGSFSRGRQDFVTPLANTTTAGLQTAWEIDLFGANRAGREAAQARLEGAQAGWHDARVAVAAEVANTYVNLRGCEAQRLQADIDARSRAETARLTGLSTRAGFESPANAALARASAAQSSSLLTQRRAQCEQLLKALVALTALTEPDLRGRLQAGEARQPAPGELAIASVPAQALAQRPDVYGAERELIAAGADVSQAQAQRLPRIVLNGSLSAARFETSDVRDSGTLWQLGPLSVSLPLFDGGRRRANVDAARARYDEAASAYRAKLRTAVREVEEALVTLQSTAARQDDAVVAVDGFAESYRATEARYRGGLASLFELEDARREALQSQIALIDLRSERSAAWIALYRALGGGWSAPGQQQASR